MTSWYFCQTVNCVFCPLKDAKAGEGSQGRDQRWTRENQSCSEKGTVFHQDQVILSGYVILKGQFSSINSITHSPCLLCLY